jgi:hypothetical protein
MDEMMELHMYKDRIVGDRYCACASLISQVDKVAS